MGLSSLLYLYEKKRLGAYSATLVSLVLATGLAATASRTAVISLFVLAGWWLAIGHLVVAACLAITIIGLPFAWALFVPAFYIQGEK